jgi:N-acetyl-gamma-glutamyl-phosphate reductase
MPSGSSGAPTRVRPLEAPDRARSDPASVPAAVFGGSGYVAGELLRLLAGHPVLQPAIVCSTSQAGEPVTSAFPHLAGTKLDGLRFTAEEEAFEPRAGLAATRGPLAVFTATPHGAAAPLLRKLFAARSAPRGIARAVVNDARRAEDASAGGASEEAAFHVVDLSADFRFADASEWAAIYGRPHPAPELLPLFTCAVPEHVASAPTPHAAQPGCFTTAAVCAAWPFFKLGLVEGDVFVSAVTGSSGSGRAPASNTHHPERHAALHAYQPLAHRHEAEMRHLIGAACRGCEPEVEFVPHSGPFVRGIHATVRMTLRRELPVEELVERVNALHGAAGATRDSGVAEVADAAQVAGARSFVVATAAPPKLTEVVGSNRCRLGIAARGRTLVVTSVLDNLVKGAAGGAIQWMNRLFGLPDSTGLELPGLGWL